MAFGICVIREAHFVSVGLQTYHPDEPLDRLPVLITVVRERDLVVLVVLLAKVQLHASTFEDTLRLAGCLVDDCWDASVRCRGGIVSSRSDWVEQISNLACGSHG